MIDKKDVIDWEAFAARVSVGVRVRAANCHWNEGVLMELWPYYAFESNLESHRVFERDDWGYEEDNLRWQRLYFQYTGFTVSRATNLHYLIDNQWLTFDEVMALPLP